jgi:hypothetical protein
MKTRFSVIFPWIFAAASQGISAGTAAKRSRHIASTAEKPPAPPPPPGTPPAAAVLDLADDWTSTRSPLLDPATRAWLQKLLSSTQLPAGWLSGRALPTTSPSTSREDAWYDAQVVVQTTSATPSCAKKHKNPFFRFVLWAAVRSKPVDISSILEDDVARFMAALNAERRNKSAAGSALAAINYVRRLNKIVDFSASSSLTSLVEAADVAFSTPKKKAPEISIDFVADIVFACCAIDQPEWRFMFGVAVLAMYMGMCRFSDLSRLRYDDGYMDVHGTHISFFIDHRKNDKRWKGHYFDVPFGDRTKAYRGLIASDIFLAAKARFLTGPFLRRVWKRGKSWHLAPRLIESGPDVGELCTMSLTDFHPHLRAELVASSGFSSSLAQEYTSHGGRAAAASELSRARIPPGQINARAGVVSENWLADYDRMDPARRFETARALRFG